MAETQEAILKVSLRDYKKEIDDLRASLLSLNETDEEYAKIANEVKEKQTKLNEVMSVGKRNSDALDGSYNALVNQMARLKKAWRETASELERKNLGQEILKINNQLKALDASTGNFQRNVGDYANAFEEAMKKSLQGLGGLDGALGNTLGTIGRLIPLIKKATQAATTGLKGVKAAIISTGVGALIVALTTIIANWDSISNAITGANDEIEKHKKLTEETLDANKKLEQKIKDETKIMNAQGKSQKQILQYQLQQNQAIQGNIEARMLELKIQIEQIEKQGWLLNLLTGERKVLKELKAQYDELDKERKSTQQTIHDLSVDIQVEDIKTTNVRGKARETQYKKTMERLKDFGKTELQVLYENANEELNLLAKEYNKKIISRKQYEEAATKVVQEFNKKRTEILQNEIDTLTNGIEDRLGKSLDENYALKQVQKIYEESYNALKKAEEEELKLYSGNEQKKLEIKEKYVKLREKLELERIANEDKATTDSLEKSYGSETSNAKRDMDMTVRGENNRFDLYSANATSFNLEAELEHIQTIYNAQEKYFNFVIQKNQEILEAENITDEERALAQQRLADAQMGLEEAKTKKTIAEIRARNKANAQSSKFTIQDAQKTAQALGSILGTINQAYEDNLRQKVENGEMSQEEAEKEFNRTKGLQYAETVMNTAAAAMGAYNSLASIPYVGPALGAAAAAAAVAAGAMQIQQIKNAKFDANGGTGEGANPIVIPPIATYAPTESTVDTGQSDVDKLSNALERTTLYVSVTDVDNAQAKQRKRNQETSW